MKKGFLLILIGALITASLGGCSDKTSVSDNESGISIPSESAKDNGEEKNNKSSSLKFDFEDGDNGFVPIFADYPNTEGAEEFYEFKYEHGEIPIADAGKGLFIAGNNHSDDLFMGYYKKIDGLIAGQNYEFSIKFKIATDVPGSMFGVGGSPGESVYVKSGITALKPESMAAENEQFRLNIDCGHQSESGTDMKVAGNMAKQDEINPDGYDFNIYELTFSIAANKDGEVYLIIGTDSGYEATTAYYIDDVELSWK